MVVGSVKLIRNLAQINRYRPGKGCVATIGTFDGVHLGHQAILSETKSRAAEMGLPTSVFSFEPMPAEFLKPDAPPARLTRFREKYNILRDIGIDEFVCPNFNERIRTLDPASFIEQLLVNGLEPAHLVVGEDFRFGAQRAGGVDELRAASKEYGFGITVVPPVFANNERISSTVIRQALSDGDLQTAQAYLGRYYRMSGRVIHGQHLGRKLGFPTANIPVKRHKTASAGIFVVHVHGLEDGRVEGVANLGTRPTVGGGGATLLEVFIFDFDRDIYGKNLDVDLIERLRDELKFKDLDTMIVQMHKDVENARSILDNIRKQ